MSAQQSTTRTGPMRPGVAEGQAVFRAGTRPSVRAPRRATASQELRELVERRAAALVELAKH